MVTTPPQQFCVRWNSYQSNLQSAFPKLLVSEHFVDVTLACENDMLKCHKVVLSACSMYFEKLLLDNPCQHPIIFMKDMKFHEIQSLVDFMYKGEVNVTQDDLPSLLKSAEALQIRGLCGSDQLLNSANFPCLKLPSTVAAPKSELQNGKDPSPPKSATADPPRPSVKQEPAEPSAAAAGETSEGSSSDSGDATAASAAVHKDHEYHNRSGGAGAGAGAVAVTVKEEACGPGGGLDSFYETEAEIMDTFLEEDAHALGAGPMRTSLAQEDLDKTSDFAIANVSCQYDGTPGSANRRVRRSDEELRRAAECITRGQTFQTVSDQFGIPISTIRFYMARKGILPRRKRGRSCAAAGPSLHGGGQPHVPIAPAASAPAYARLGAAAGAGAGAAGNTSPVGPPFHIVHYKLPPLGVSPKLK